LQPSCAVPRSRGLPAPSGAELRIRPRRPPYYDTQHRLPSSISPPGSVPSLLMLSTYAEGVSMSTMVLEVPPGRNLQLQNSEY